MIINLGNKKEAIKAFEAFKANDYVSFDIELLNSHLKNINDRVYPTTNELCDYLDELAEKVKETITKIEAVNSTPSDVHEIVNEVAWLKKVYDNATTDEGNNEDAIQSLKDAKSEYDENKEDESDGNTDKQSLLDKFRNTEFGAGFMSVFDATKARKEAAKAKKPETYEDLLVGENSIV